MEGTKIKGVSELALRRYKEMRHEVTGWCGKLYNEGLYLA
jgi:hypothetical protein